MHPSKVDFDQVGSQFFGDHDGHIRSFDAGGQQWRSGKTRRTA